MNEATIKRINPAPLLSENPSVIVTIKTSNGEENVYFNFSHPDDEVAEKMKRVSRLQLEALFKRPLETILLEADNLAGTKCRWEVEETQRGNRIYENIRLYPESDALTDEALAQALAKI